MVKQPCVYFLSSRKHGTIYAGVTSNIVQRLHQHREKRLPGFSEKYGVCRLVWYELHETMESAIQRKSGSRSGGETGKFGELRKKILIGLIWRPASGLSLCQCLTKNHSVIPAKAGIHEQHGGWFGALLGK